MRRRIGHAAAFAAILLWTGAAGAEISSAATGNLDTRWLPWIGSWKLVFNTFQDSGGGAEIEYGLEISPGDDGKSIIMKSYRGGKFQLEKRVAVDESRQPLQDTRCSGWYRYFWSDTGKRLLFESVSSCPGEEPRFVSGMSIITKDQLWMDVQRLKCGDDIAISVRKYQAAGRDIGNEANAVIAPVMARFPAGSNLSIDEIVELSHKVAAEVIAATLVELRQTFPINSKTLTRLADGGVSSEVVDLMVALSFPSKFTVEQNRITPVREYIPDNSGDSAEPPYIWLPFGYWSIYGPYSPWYWYPSYGYWGSGWYIWSGGGHSSDHHGGDDGHGGGRLVNGRGYSSVAPAHGNSGPRYAQPRGSSENSGGQNGTQPASNTAPAAAGGSPSSPAGSSAGSGGGSTRDSSTASPGGYHSGSGEGSHARPRD